MQFLEPDTWEAAAKRIAQREVVVWSWVAVRPKGRAPALYALTVRSRSLVPGDLKHANYGRIELNQEAITGEDASKRFLDGSVGPALGDLAGLSFPTPPVNQGSPTVWLASGERWGFGPESSWPTYYFELRLMGDVDQLTWQVGFDDALATPGLPAYSHGRDAVFALLFGIAPPWPNPALYPQVAVRLTDERARLGSISLSGSRMLVQVEEAVPGRKEKFLLQGTWRHKDKWELEHKELLVGRDEIYSFDVGDRVSEFSVFLLDPQGNRIDSREWKPSTLPGASSETSKRSVPTNTPKVKRHQPSEEATGSRASRPPRLAPSGANVDVSKAQDAHAVAVVYGRNTKAKNALFEFLRALGLNPKEWGQLVKELGQGSPYIGHVVKNALEKAQAIVVLLTGDDEAQLRKEFRDATDPHYELNPTPQPRQNVLFEAGMAIGYNETRTIIVEFGDRRPFSDIQGRHVVKIGKGTEWRNDLAQRLISAGCDVNMSGNDWLSAGTFPRERTTAQAQRKQQRPSLRTPPVLEVDDQARCFRLRVLNDSRIAVRVRVELIGITDDDGNPLLPNTQLPIELNWTHQLPDVRPALSRLDEAGQSVAVLCYDQNPIAAEAELYVYGMYPRPRIGRVWSALKDRTINLTLALTVPEDVSAGRIVQRFSLRFNESAPLRFDPVPAL